MIKKDSRIKIVNNHKNRGLLFSRAMGILYSKGEYLMNLDPDDALENSESLRYLYRKIKNSKPDVIKFGMLFKNNLKKERIFKCKSFNKIIYQPQIFNDGCILEDFFITNKLIKKNILIKAFESFKQNIYGEKWNYAEDEIWGALVNKNANSLICVNKIIYTYFINSDSLIILIINRNNLSALLVCLFLIYEECLITNKYNIIYLKNLLYWLKMFTKIFDIREYEKYLMNRILLILELIKEDNYKNIFKKEIELKKNYIKVLQNINMKRFNNYNDVLNNIIEYLKFL